MNLRSHIPLEPPFLENTIIMLPAKAQAARTQKGTTALCGGFSREQGYPCFGGPLRGFLGKGYPVMRNAHIE